jgi:hypothetical protein
MIARWHVKMLSVSCCFIRQCFAGINTFGLTALFNRREKAAPQSFRCFAFQRECKSNLSHCQAAEEAKKAR